MAVFSEVSVNKVNVGLYSALSWTHL